MSTTKSQKEAKATSKLKGRPKEFCRNDALEKAKKVFSEKGYEAASVAQLGAAMNMNPPSLYNAFGDKEKLFIEVLDQYYKPLEDGMQNLFASTKSTREAVQKLMAASKNNHARPNAIGCLMVNSSINVRAEDSPISKKIKSLHNNTEKLINKRLHEGQKNGDLPADVQTTKLARYIHGVILGAAVLARGQQSPAAVKDFLDQGYEGFLKLAKIK